MSRVGPSPLTRGERPASIRATVVKRTATGFVAVTGWAFNNLTYLGVAGPAWAINPLARTGTYASAGRLWSTTCTPDCVRRATHLPDLRVGDGLRPDRGADRRVHLLAAQPVDVVGILS